MAWTRHGFSRRALFRMLAMSISSVTLAPSILSRAAYAQQKVSKSQAQYQDAPNRDQRCSGCASFQPPEACQVVEGKVSPEGWCALFAPKPR